MNRLRETRLENLGLQTALQEILDLQGKHVIEPHTALVEHTNTDQSTDKSVTLEETLRVLVIELEQLTGCTADLGQNKRDAPNLALVAQTVLSRELELSIETGSLVRSTRDLISF